MINSAIFWKTLRDSRSAIIAATLGIIGFVVLFVRSMLDMGTDLMEFVSRFEFLKKIFEFGLGIDVSGEISISVLFAVCFTHAMLLILALSTIIATVTRVTVGEVERGTADLLLTLPVSRSEVYVSTTLVWVLAAAVLACCPVIGVWIGSVVFETEEVIDVTRYFVPALNLFFMIFAVGGISSLIACCVNRRGMAIAILVGFLLSSMVLNFIEPFIEPVKYIRFLGLLTYFRPVDIVRSGNWPITEMATLVGVGLSGWLVGLVVFCRKDIPSA